MQTFHFESIGIVHSPYREKFGIPRQPGLVDAEATLELLPPYNRPEAVKGLEGFSHIWITFVFHGVKRSEWKPMVRPPRLGGNERVGVFASRATHRPNPIGLSVVELSGIDCSDKKVVLHLKGADMLDGTPVLDIKPYIPYADNVEAARSGFADKAPAPLLEVVFSAAAGQQCEELSLHYPQLPRLITDVLALDPRPAYQAEEGREYGVILYDFNIRFRVTVGCVEVLAIESVG
ncbi:tRNA (N6-threonylcarbamoyladenosine(37)-N6)-methyltransferase TrmO [Sedimenticola sp.]|uniref:tRNA (N6-threonylcarbamoyladenosine(37)-N6)-methyltransferase TrmO n=1 Tax=Sedimenticola sp. TaxID=1940285 RepID=UPI003D09D627